MDIDVSKLSTSAQVKVDKIFVTVYQLGSLQDKSFQGFAKSISSISTKGPFDVLPGHENFISQFKDKLEIVTESGEKVRFDHCNGVIEIANNVAKVFLKKQPEAEKVGNAVEER